MGRCDNKKEVFLVDICGTLYRSNTTFDFLAFFFHSKRWHKIVEAFRSIRVFMILNALVMKLLHKDILRIWAISHLDGFSHDELLQMAILFHKDFLLQRENKEVMDIIRVEKKRGKKIVIVSATLDVIADVVAEYLEADVVLSSKLSYNNNICNGCLSEDLLANKLRILTEFGENPPYWGVITDNYSDADIIMKSQNAYLVQYRGRHDRWSFVSRNKKCNIKKIMINE